MSPITPVEGVSLREVRISLICRLTNEPVVTAYHNPEHNVSVRYKLSLSCDIPVFQQGLANDVKPGINASIFFRRVAEPRPKASKRMAFLVADIKAASDSLSSSAGRGTMTFDSLSNRPSRRRPLKDNSRARAGFIEQANDLAWGASQRPRVGCRRWITDPQATRPLPRVRWRGRVAESTVFEAAFSSQPARAGAASIFCFSFKCKLE